MTVIKKWKAGRTEKAGVIQVKLRNIGDNVVLEEVDTGGNRKLCGSILSVYATGLQLHGGFESKGIATDTSNTIKLKG